MVNFSSEPRPVSLALSLVAANGCWLRCSEVRSRAMGEKKLLMGGRKRSEVKGQINAVSSSFFVRLLYATLPTTGAKAGSKIVLGQDQPTT